MSDILEDLFYNKFMAEYEPTSVERGFRRKIQQHWEAIDPLISAEKREEMQNFQSAAETDANLSWFREGFRLGAALMLELL